ncbi:chorismate synthase [Nonlabens sp.]|uniref:chorismate synthase n=1 Tax=Nonlabens sp. TaxID=1888209 RepID=UPI003265CAC0
MLNKILYAFCIVALISCDSNDDNDGNMTNTDFNYFPLSVTNTWDFEITTGTDTPSNESLTVETVSGTEFTLISDPIAPTGFMTRILSGGALKSENGALIGNGNIDFGLQGLNNFNVAIENGTLYDQNANINAELFSTTGTTSQTVDGYDLDITYEVRTVQQEDIAQMVVEGITYSDIIHSQLIINATVTTDILTQQIALLTPQDVIVINNYWSRDIGLIKSDNQLNYQLSDFSSFGFTLPVPQSASILTTQNLVTYTVL